MKRLFLARVPGIVSSESQNDVAVVGHGDRVLQRRSFELSVQQAPPVQVEGMLQADLFDGRIRRSSHANDIERVAVEMAVKFEFFD